ncbi:uncharacterized protein LOC113512531 [Galleria mellonella]|uniref:Uncharacterized protein LOC113512531 n=1 Tax=Galleria mellonella TaxID=7137 RepID=A0A6J3CBQ3_GALME|nr:uncharacterized protein LOC113512531 [Galleria mellonella]
MSSQIFYFILILSPALSRHVPRYSDLDEEDQHLFRAAYDTPAYNQDEYQEPDDLHLGKLDLVKDGLWALKAKIKELKAFDKALAANMLDTKLKVKDLLENHLKPIMNHHHVDVYDKKKPYGYQAPYPQHDPQYPPEPHYIAPPYPGPVPQYGGQQYGHDPYYGH